MTDNEIRIQELMTEIKSLKEKNISLEDGNREASHQRDLNDAAGEVRYRTVFENCLLGNKIIYQDQYS